MVFHFLHREIKEELPVTSGGGLSLLNIYVYVDSLSYTSPASVDSQHSSVYNPVSSETLTGRHV